LTVNAYHAYVVGMAVLNIRNLPDGVHARLRVRAARKGRSMEAEARDILTRACEAEAVGAWAPEEVQAYFDDLLGADRPSGAVDELIAERRREAANEE
jgi:antitoxin FitA